MKTVFSGHELPHIWARQTQDEGKGSSMFFNGKLIYSYGYHFCMGKLFPDNVVVLTDRSYSITTSKHLGYVSGAVTHMERIYMPYPEKSLSENAKQIISNIQDQLNVLSNPRKKDATKEQAKIELASIVSNVERFSEITKEPLNKKWYDKDLKKEFLLYLNAAKDEQAGKELTAKLQKVADNKRRQATRKQKLALIEWLNGVVKNPDPTKVYLRVKNDDVETTKGARVSLKSAKVLFKLIQSGKDVKGFDLEGYTVTGLNGMLHIGCHDIDRTEIDRFAKTQNWI